MIAQLLEFSIKHIALVSAIIAILCALGVINYLQWTLGARAISPTRATLLINRHQAAVLDLREELEFLKAHLPKAAYLSHDSWAALRQQLKPSCPIILITSRSMPPFKWLKALRAEGFSELYYLEGGLTAWEQANLPMIRS